MLSTFLLISAFSGMIVAEFVLAVWFMRQGLRWAKASDSRVRLIVIAILTNLALQLVVHVLLALWTPTTPRQWRIHFLLYWSAIILIPCFVIMRRFRISFERSVLVWLFSLLPIVFMVFIVGLGVRPYLYEAFAGPSNNMTPTLLGIHSRNVCAECGQTAYCAKSALPEPGEEIYEAVPLICHKFHVTRTQTPSTDLVPQDRFIVTKFIKPRRWDIVAFRLPSEPEIQYVSRLVGLPGENIEIIEGEVYANRQKLPLPDFLQGLKYDTSPEAVSGSWGSPEKPAQLGPDEYFVLGDFSAVSADSRYWSTGAEGHNEFAVPQSHMMGIVSHIYWPPERWRAFR